ncbi:MAG: glycosyltransferase family 87 protein [Pseudolabrys sp.]
MRGNERSYSAPRVVAIAGVTLALAYSIVLGGALIAGQWLLDPQGRPLASDFVNVWAAGRLALDGNAALAYDWTAHKAAEITAVGHPFDNYFGWHYPPPFLFAAAALALLPFLPAAMFWLAATLPLYAFAIRSIVGERAGYFLALGFPAALWNAAAGQNGFLTAALIGGTLTLLERRPVLAGVCLGLLAYKPHFGLLFPLALIAGARWRVIAGAAATAGLMIVLSLLAFGSESWTAFFHWMPATSAAVLGQGLADFDRLQSLFGLIRAHGGSETLAWGVQAATTLALAVTIFHLWRSKTEFALKAAALAAAALIATPYLYMYDLVVLAVPVAYLVRVGLARGFSRVELIGLPAAGLLLLIYPYLKTQVGLAAVLIVAGLVVQRVIGHRAR